MTCLHVSTRNRGYTLAGGYKYRTVTVRPPARPTSRDIIDTAAKIVFDIFAYSWM